MPLEPTEVQKLRLQLAQRQCDLNLAQRCHMEAELRFYQLVLHISGITLPRVEEELARQERQAEQLTQTFLELGEQIKAENGWPDAVRWDPTTLTYSASAENGCTAVPEQAGENKIRIH